MATAISAPRGELKLEYGRPEVVTFKFVQARNFEGQYGARGLFTLGDERKLWLDAEDASDVERALRDQDVCALRDYVRLTKVKMPRGGGHAIRAERVQETPRETRYDNAPEWVDAPPAQAWEQPRPSREEMLLEQSVALARQHGARAFQRPPSRVSPETPPAAAPSSTDTGNSTGFAFQLKPAFIAAIDAIADAQRYADAQGLKVTFTSEDVRAAAISAFIQAEKAATGARY
jgi:hypothetical protein